MTMFFQSAINLLNNANIVNSIFYFIGMVVKRRVKRKQGSAVSTCFLKTEKSLFPALARNTVTDTYAINYQFFSYQNNNNEKALYLNYFNR